MSRNRTKKPAVTRRVGSPAKLYATPPVVRIGDAGSALARWADAGRVEEPHKSVAYRLCKETILSTEPTPERQAVLDQAIDLLERTPTNLLVSYLPVLGRYATPSPLRAVRTDCGSEGA